MQDRHRIRLWSNEVAEDEMQAIRIAAHPFSPGQHHGMATDLHTSSPGFHIVLSTLRFADNELVSRTITQRELRNDSAVVLRDV
jgi:hypothetical protein